MSFAIVYFDALRVKICDEDLVGPHVRGDSGHVGHQAEDPLVGQVLWPIGIGAR